MSEPAPPVAEKRPHVHTDHGVERDDPYAWLRDREDPAVLAHLAAENAYADAMTAHTKALEDAIYAEMLGRIQETDTTAEIPRGPYRYFNRTVEGKPYAIHCRRPRDGGDEQVLLDENALAAGHDYFSLGVATVSPDHALFAYAWDTNGAERYTLRILHLETGRHLPLELDNVKANAAWATDGRTLFFTVPDEADRPFQLWRVDVLGGEPELVYEEPDARFYLSISRTRSDRFLVLSLGSHSTTELRVIPADAPDQAPAVLYARRDGVEAGVDHQPGRFLVRTNDGARTFQLVAIPDDDLSAAPKVVVPADPAVSLEDVDAFAGHVVLSLRDNGLPVLRVIDAKGKTHDVSFPEPVYDVSMAASPEFDGTRIHFTYTSLVTPATTFAYDLAKKSREAIKVQPVPGYDASAYVTERLWATAADGTKVPISLLRKKDTKKTGKNPLFLAGYGAYGIHYSPVFASTVFSLVDRGFLYAIAHIRGGGAMGRPWYESGKFEHKTNTFSDFIACAEHLEKEKWTVPNHLVIQGGSAGGLLIGNVLNQRPDLFGAAISRVPFVDVVTTMLDETLPLTVIEYDEWGNPNDRDVFDRMLAYSPYDNIGAKDYPPILVTGGLNDPRVGYWEPAKWVARLRERKTGTNPVIFRCHMGAGHAGESGRYGRLRDLAFLYAFAIDRVTVR